MARRRRGGKPYRKFSSKFQVLPVNVNIGLATLANNTVVKTPLITIADDFWVQSGDLSFALQDATASEGPLYFGVSNGDLSVTEIKEGLNALPTSRSDIIEREKARRPIRRLGQFSVAGVEEVWNDGRMKRVSIKMYLAEGIDIDMWVMNVSGATLTTGAIIQTTGVLYGEWR